MPILVRFKKINKDNSYFYKNIGLSFPCVPFYLKQEYCDSEVILCFGTKFKGISLSKALNCMKFFLYKQIFYQGDGYLWYKFQ